MDGSQGFGGAHEADCSCAGPACLRTRCHDPGSRANSSRGDWPPRNSATLRSGIEPGGHDRGETVLLHGNVASPNVHRERNDTSCRARAGTGRTAILPAAGAARCIAHVRTHHSPATGTVVHGDRERLPAVPHRRYGGRRTAPHLRAEGAFPGGFRRCGGWTRVGNRIRYRAASAAFRRHQRGGARPREPHGHGGFADPGSFPSATQRNSPLHSDHGRGHLRFQRRVSGWSEYRSGTRSVLLSRRGRGGRDHYGIAVRTFGRDRRARVSAASAGGRLRAGPATRQHHQGSLGRPCPRRLLAAAGKRFPRVDLSTDGDWGRVRLRSRRAQARGPGARLPRTRTRVHAADSAPREGACGVFSCGRWAWRC